MNPSSLLAGCSRLVLLGALLALGGVPSGLAGGAGAPVGSTRLDPPADLGAAGPVREVQLAAAADGTLTLAVIADAGTASSRRGPFTARSLQAWNSAGEQWQALGGVLNYDQPRPIANLNLVLDNLGTPVLVWNENYGDNDVVVFRAFQGGQWTDWRARYIGDDLPYAARTRAVAAYGGEPVLAWGEYLRKPYGSRLTVRTWDGQTWTRSPAFNDIQAFSRTPAMALDAAGQPTVAWIQGDVLASNIYAKRWTGDHWEALGGVLNRHPETYLASTRMVMGAGEQPVVAWIEDVGGQDGLFASEWNGQTWIKLGGRIGNRFASAPSLALDRQGRPVLAWVEEHGSQGVIKLARWNGQSWQDFGPINRDPLRDARSPSLAVDQNNRLILAWREDQAGKYRVQLQRFGP
ncbi:hypothetical protein [Deinococcus irradiatisoli]|uniref:hypothetical protein n=1 Tax=Deinococcus irradiatisoli TaxID=2202254 RepID=UPI0015E87602|nr:hypothetical protein [Deinococcus irradiatisoli]